MGFSRSLFQSSLLAKPGWALRLLVALLATCLPLASPTHGADVPPGVRPCITNDLPAGYGTFLFLKSATFLQTSDATPIETNSTAAALVVELVPPEAFGISNALVTGPGGARIPLALGASGASSGGGTYTNEAALNAAVLPGPWSTQFQVVYTNEEQFVGIFLFTVASNVPPIPQIANLQAGQSIDPATNFTLSWTPWVGSATHDRISLAVVSPGGQVVASAATDCAGNISLPTGATSVEIPAGGLPGGTTYTGYLTFGGSLFDEIDDSALHVRRGFQSRTTQFTLRTTGSSGGTSGTFTNVHVAGTNLVFTLTGAPGTVFQIQSTSDLLAWMDESSVTLPASGEIEVMLPIASGGVPRFYRAVSTGGGTPTGEPASLGVALQSTNELAITITGTPGATYTLEFSTDFATWNEVQDVPIPAGTNSVTVNVTIATGVPFVVYRATLASGPPTPGGNNPSLALTRDGSNFRITVTGGDAQRTYTLQKAGPTLANWTDTPTTVTTDATGAGSATVIPVATEPVAFYRAMAQ